MHVNIYHFSCLICGYYPLILEDYVRLEEKVPFVLQTSYFGVQDKQNYTSHPNKLMDFHIGIWLVYWKDQNSPFLISDHSLSEAY